MANCTIRDIDTLKCALCDGYLSVPPISIIVSEGDKQKCGRCDGIPTPPTIRNVGYENVARFISFPCIYECNQKIPWKDVQNHEIRCPQRTIQCPIYWQGCSERIRITYLHCHFNEYHTSHIFQEIIVTTLENGKSNVFLLIKHKKQFLVYITTELSQEMIYIAVYSFDRDLFYKAYSFEAKLSSINKPDFCLHFENQQILPFDEQQHCRKCAGRECDLMHHRYSITNCCDMYNVFSSMKAAISSQLVTAALDSNDIIYTINITGEAKDFSTASTQTPTVGVPKENVSNKFLRQCLECLVCREYMEAPIFTCQTGHAICRMCKPKLEKCALCKMPIGETRNYSLESIAENIELQCTYTERGCTFVGTIREIPCHEDACDYSATEY